MAPTYIREVHVAKENIREAQPLNAEKFTLEVHATNKDNSNSEEEYQKAMDFMCGGNGSGDKHKETSKSEKGKRRYHRHSPQQIQSLEAFFKECPHPDEEQRHQLSRDLGLEPQQTKCWFQNRRTQLKAQAERADNSVLRAENEKIHFENLAMKDRLQNLICSTCNSKHFGVEDRQSNLQKLQTENSVLKKEYQRISDLVYNVTGTPVRHLDLLSPTPGSITSLSEEKFLGQGMGVPSFDQETVERTSVNFMSPYHLSRIQELEKSLMVKTAAWAMNELLELLQVNEPLWIMSSTHGRYFLHGEIYDKHYPKTIPFKNLGGWIESSKDSGIVPMTAVHLIEIFSDSKKWMDLFPTIVTEVRTIGTLDTGGLGGSMHLMYAKLHILSPLVEPRKYIFLRYSRQLDSSTWAIVDTSYDSFNKLQDGSFWSWRLPSGCMIQEMPNGKAEVSWVEHVQVDGKSFSDPLFRGLVWSCQAYGAKRWIVTLQRMSERFALSVGPGTMTITGLEGVVDAHKGRKGLMDLSHRMVKNFCEILSTPEKLDFGHLAKLKNSDFQVSVRESSGLGQPHGLIVCVAASLWLPAFCENLFEFFKDEKTRAQWDVLSDGSVVNEIARIATGANSGNYIAILRPFFPTRDGTMMLLQESCIDPLGGLVIYAPMDISSFKSVINGQDTSAIPILPSGFIISGDGGPLGGDGASTSSGVSSRSGGSILTQVFQMLMSSNTSKELSIQSIESIRDLMRASIARIKMAIGCPSLD